MVRYIQARVLKRGGRRVVRIIAISWYGVMRTRNLAKPIVALSAVEVSGRLSVRRALADGLDSCASPPAWLGVFCCVLSFRALDSFRSPLQKVQKQVEKK